MLFFKQYLEYVWPKFWPLYKTDIRFFFFLTNRRTWCPTEEMLPLPPPIHPLCPAPYPPPTPPPQKIVAWNECCSLFEWKQGRLAEDIAGTARGNNRIAKQVCSTVKWMSNSHHVIFLYSNPATNGGLQNGSSVGICTECTHVFAHSTSIWMLSRCLLTKFLHRRSVGSWLRVRCWLGYKALLEVVIIFFCEMSEEEEEKEEEVESANCLSCHFEKRRREREGKKLLRDTRLAKKGRNNCLKRQWKRKISRSDGWWPMKKKRTCHNFLTWKTLHLFFFCSTYHHHRKPQKDKFGCNFFLF